VTSALVLCIIVTARGLSWVRRSEKKQRSLVYRVRKLELIHVRVGLLLSLKYVESKGQFRFERVKQVCNAPALLRDDLWPLCWKKSGWMAKSEVRVLRTANFKQGGKESRKKI